MLKKSSHRFALCLIVPFILSSQVSAGHFGLFRHCRAKPTCGPVDCCPTDAVSTSSATAVPETTKRTSVVVCYVRAVAIGENSMGYTCTSYSDWHSNENCVMAKDKAYQDAVGGLPSDCTLQRVAFDCVPRQYCRCCDSVSTKAMRATGCQYKVTYKLCCCDGVAIEYSVIDPVCAIAKKRAKDAAFFQASLECRSKIRSCRWTICRTSATAQ